MEFSGEPSVQLQETLEKLEVFLKSSTNLQIPDDFPKDPLPRSESLLKMVQSLNRSCILSSLPEILELLQHQDCYNFVLDLLYFLLSPNSEEILEIVAQSADKPKIKKQCLSIIKDLLQKADMRGLHRVMHNLAGVINDPDREIATLAREVCRKIRDSIFRSVPPVRKNENNDLVFGIIPSSLFSDYISTENKKAKHIALKCIEEIILNASDLNPIENHQNPILQFLLELLLDTSRSFINCGLRISLRLTSIENFNMSKLNSILKTKLGDSSIGVRQGAFKILVHNFKFWTNLGQDLLSGFDNENWHIREETVCLYIAGMLMNHDFSKLDLTEKFCKLLDDEKSKIRQAVFEAFAVMGKNMGKDQLVEKIKGLVDELTLKNIQERLELEQIATLKDGLLQMPRIVPSSAPIAFSTRSSFSPFPTPTSTQDMHFDFSQNYNTNSPAPRSSSQSQPTLTRSSKKPENSSIFKQSSDFIKPPLPIRKSSKKTLTTESKEDFSRNTFIDKTYTEFNNLQPLSSPLDMLNQILIENGDAWDNQFDYTDTIRRVIKFHKELLNMQNSHKFVVELIKWGDSLRSALCKNSLIALGDFCRELPKLLDPDVEGILALLLRKSIDTNIFISETAVDSLTLCVTNCSIGRIISAILGQMASAKSGALKSKIAYSCKFILQRIIKGPIPGGIDRMVISLASYVQEAAPEVRESARECFLSLGKELDKLLSKFLTDSTCKTVKDILERDAKRKTTNRSVEPKRNSSTRSTKRSIATRSTSNRLRISQNFEKDLSEVNEINSALMNEDWKIRFRTLEKIAAGILEDVENNQNNSRILSLIDALCRTITDHNSKVSMQSLSTLKELVPKMKWALQPNLGLLISSIVVTLGSSSIALRNISKEICDIIMESCEAIYIIGPFTSAINVANPRARAVLVSCVNKVLQEVYEKKPGLVKKLAVPLMYKIVDDPNIEVKEQAEIMVCNMKVVLGDEFLKHAPENKSEKIREIIGKNIP
ncbi:hypothetical protein SteCoe_3153 [Stentor coeruleus]|uniref:TOG domain-containing protein n=1 Tax=Stentor coeruleus TaxID=5963 RepID=A0A1R2CXU2_9CILI|nr:hypothetical protein SteCoe_3153 [Stentor coeruleus]